jgi:site-specific DNA recombinase
MIPALALEQAVMDRILSLGTRDEDRKKVVEAALGAVEAETNKVDSEIETIRHRPTTVQTEIQNLMAALKVMGSAAVASVKDELVKLEEEKRQLRDRLRDHAKQAAPKTAAATAAAKRFIDTWSSMGELLMQATPEEQRTILQRYIEVVEITFDDPLGKIGKYVLRLFPEVRPLDATPSRNENGTPIPGGDGGSVLTEDRIVCQSESKARRRQSCEVLNPIDRQTFRQRARWPARCYLEGPQHHPNKTAAAGALLWDKPARVEGRDNRL